MHTIEEFEGWQGGVVVPTMGALHAGHARLIERAAMLRAERGWRCPVVVTVFVNPTQFNDPKDLARYPRTLDADVEIGRRAGADVVFAPSVSTVYPGDGAAQVPVLPPAATEPGLEDALRPGHFAGVCQVVRRLFELVSPRAAMFGEKDWQQLQVVSAMAHRDTPGVEIVPVATVREADGLAMSSRNVFLSASERVRAGAIAEALCEASGVEDWQRAERLMRVRLEAAGLEVEYAVIRESATLRQLPAGYRRLPGAARALIAARFPSVRLIDNAAW